MDALCYTSREPTSAATDKAVDFRFWSAQLWKRRNDAVGYSLGLKKGHKARCMPRNVFDVIFPELAGVNERY